MKWFAQPSVVFGAFMLCTETCDHFDAIARGDWLNMPIHDWTAAGLLVMAGVGSQRGWGERRAFRAVAWAFMLSLLFGAFFGHLAEWLAPTEPAGWIPERVVFPVLIALNGIAILALVGTLAGHGAQESD
jgi:hypothetical protein